MVADKGAVNVDVESAEGAIEKGSKRKD